tara:strand:+ start:4066 stop:4338 length:273 start_codon:yes stop_codon:yes gene_type:complete
MISKEKVQQLFIYNRLTGEIRWKADFNSRAKGGSIAGYIDGQGYRQITVFGKKYTANKIAWIFLNGRYEGKIKNIDGNRLNNSIANLKIK